MAIQHMGMHPLERPDFENGPAFYRSECAQCPIDAVIGIKGQVAGVKTEFRRERTVPSLKRIDGILVRWPALLVLIEYLQRTFRCFLLGAL